MERALNRKSIHTALYIAYLVLVAYFCLRPMPPRGPLIPHFDKVAHFGIYFLASIGLLYITSMKRWGISLLFLFCYGVGIEFLQRATGYRSFELLDIAANTAGLLVGTALYRLKNPR